MAAIAEAGPAYQGCPTRPTLQGLEDAAGELARAMRLLRPRSHNQSKALTLAGQHTLNPTDLNNVNLKRINEGNSRYQLGKFLEAGIAL